MKFHRLTLTALSLLFLGAASRAQVIEQKLRNPDNEPRPVHPLPTKQQMAWHELEFYAFYHYGMNTFTGREWGYGDEDEKIYAPQQLPNVRQWVETAKRAGMRGGIAVVKHHDGFCLWPTVTTTHSVLRSSGVGPQVNIPKQFAEASEALGMRYGFYISPWDRNSAYYGTDRYVSDVFFKQIQEVAAYGSDQFEMWFDGANGGDGYYGGAREHRNIDDDIYYDYFNTADIVKKVQPNTIVWGEVDARWIGNEAGFGYTPNWNTLNKPHTSNAQLPHGDSNGWAWFPAESDAKATNRGWFWHEGEQPHSSERLYRMYIETVGRGATLLLNLPPNREGVLPQATVDAVVGMGDLLRQRLTNDYAPQATITATNTRAKGKRRRYDARCLTDGRTDTYWATDDSVASPITLTLTWRKPIRAHYVVLNEYIRKGQRIELFSVEYTTDGTTWRAAEPERTNTVGYRRIVPLSGSTATYGEGYDVRAIRITIQKAKASPLLHTLSVY